MSIEIGASYTGSDNLDKAGKEIRRELKLPLTKQLVYYRDSSDVDSMMDVLSYQAINRYDISETWFTLELLLEDHSTVRIHSSYFAEMQQPTFVDLMTLMQEGTKKPTSISSSSKRIVTIKANVDKNSASYIKKRFISIDTETTGFSPERDRIIEIGAVLFENGIPVLEYSSLINAHKHVSEEASSVNHITDEMLKSAPEESEVYRSFVDFLGDALEGKTIVCAHNASFDMQFLQKTLSRLGYSGKIIYVDTLTLAKQYVDGLDDYKQGALEEYYGIINEQAHRACSDAKACGKILYNIIDSIDI